MAASPPYLDVSTVMVDGVPDWELDGDLVLERSLRTAVLNAIFSDRRYVPGEHPAALDPGEDRRGWCLENPDRPWGSLAWTLPKVLAPSVVAQWKLYTEQALAFLVADNIAESVEVTAEAVQNRLELGILVIQGTATGWPSAWRAERLELEVGPVFLVLEAA